MTDADTLRLHLAVLRELLAEKETALAELEAASRKTPPRGIVDDGAYAAPPGATSELRLPPAWAVEDGVRACTLNVGLGELLDEDCQRVRRDVLDAQLEPMRAWNRANPDRRLRAQLRLHAGQRAPRLWHDVCGTVEVTDSSFGKRSRVPRWWEPAFRGLYVAAMDLLGPVVDDAEDVCLFTTPLGAYWYPEPFLLHANSRVTSPSDTNGDRLLAGGWSWEEHAAYLRWAATSEVHEAFQRTPVALAVNPAATVGARGGAGRPDVDLTVEVAEAFAASRPPGMAVLVNYSWREQYLADGGAYGRLYEAMRRWAAAGVPCGVQLARPHRLPASWSAGGERVWPLLVEAAASDGWCLVETPSPGGALSGAAVEANAWPWAWERDRPRVRELVALFG